MGVFDHRSFGSEDVGAIGFDTAHFDPEAIFRALEGAADEMAEAQAQAELLEELRKSRLAALTLDYLRENKSRVSAETMALADPHYEKYVKGMVQARRRHARAQARFRNLHVLAELLRTQESSRRQSRA